MKSASDDSQKPRAPKAERAEAVWIDAAKHGVPDLADLQQQHPDLAREFESIAADWGWLEGQVGECRAREVPLNLAGELDAERYTRLERLAEGGGGRVDRIWDGLLERSLAIKVAKFRTPHEQAAHSRLVARFLREAQVTSQLQHPGIVPVHDVGVDAEGFWFYTMNLVEGMDLGEAFGLARAGKDEWSLQRAVRALSSVADTLAYAHDRGVLHRDVKPSNVRVGPFGEVYVMDWGLARLTSAHEHEQLESSEAHPSPPRSGDSSQLTVEGSIMGTPAYMPPEQARGEVAELDPRVDVYALGAMLYELLAGVAPYADQRYETPAEAALAVAREAPRALAEAAGDAPLELVAIAERAMARSREDRYRDMSDLASELRAYLDGRVVRAHRTGAFVEVEKWVLRNRISAAALVLLLASLASAAWIQYQGARKLRGANQTLSDTNVDLEVAREEALGEAHFARLAAAQASLRVNNGRAAANLLESCPSDQRSWAWRHLWSRAVNDEDRHEVRIGFAGPLSFDCSSKGRFAAGHNLMLPRLGGGDRVANELILYDLEHGRDRVIAPSLGGVIVRFIPGTSRLLLVTRSSLSLHDAEREGAIIVELDSATEGVGQILAAVSGDGRYIVTRSNDGDFLLRSSEDLRVMEIWTPEFPLDQGWAIALSHDGALLAGIDRGGTLHFMDARGKSVAKAEFGRLDLAGYPPRLHFADEVDLCAVGLSSGGLEIFDARSGERLVSIPAFNESISALAFDPAGVRVACGAWDGTVAVFDVRTGTPLFRGFGNEAMVVDVGWNGEGGSFWSASRDGSLRTWQFARSDGLDLLRSVDSAQLDAFADPLRERLATIHVDGLLLLWDTETGDPIARCDSVLQVGFVPMSGCFDPVTGDLIVSTRRSGLMRLEAETLEVLDRAGTIGGTLLEIDDQGRRLACASDGIARVVLVDDLAAEHVLPNISNATGFAFDERGKELWVGEMAGSLSLWELGESKPMLVNELNLDGEVCGVSRSGDLLAVGMMSGRIELRSAENGAFVHLLGVNPGPVECLEFHPQDSLLLSSGRTTAGDASLRLWDIDRRQLRAELLGAGGRLRDASFGADGAWIAGRLSQKSGVVLLDEAPRYRGLPEVTLALESVRDHIDKLFEECPHPEALSELWSLQAPAGSAELRAGRRLAFERFPSLSGSANALQHWLPRIKQESEGAEVATILARFVARRSEVPSERLRAGRVLLYAGYPVEACSILEAVHKDHPAPDLSLTSDAGALSAEIENWESEHAPAAAGKGGGE